jgi:hypothetical protein
VLRDLRKNNIPGVRYADANSTLPIGTLFVCDSLSYRRMGLSEAKLLENYPDLTATDLANAWSYSEAQSVEIHRAIAQQDEA